MEQSQHLSARVSVRRAVFISVIMFLTMTTHYIYKSGVSGRLIKAFTAYKMPWLQLCDAVLGLAFIGIMFYARVSRRKLSRTVGLVSIGIAVFISLFNLIVQPGDADKPALFFLGVAISLLVSAATYGVWMLLVNTAFERNWLTLTIVGLGAQLGVLAGSWIGKLMSFPGAMPYMPSLIGLLYVPVFVLLGYGIRKFSCGGIVFAPAPEEKRSSSFARFAQRYKANSTGYAAVIMALVLAGNIFGQSINWRLQQMADFKPTAAAASHFLGDFYMFMAVCSLACQLLITPVAIRFLPAWAGMLLQPLLGVLLAFVIGSDASMSLNVTGLLVFSALDYTVYNAYKEKLWMHAPLFSKVYHKAVAGLLIPKIGTIIQALAVLFLATRNITIWAGFVGGIALLWIVAIVFVLWLNAYRRSLSITDFKASINDV